MFLNCQTLVKFFRDHAVPRAVLKEYCERLYGQHSGWAPPLGVATRWGSHFRVLQYVHRKKTALDGALRDERCISASGVKDAKTALLKVSSSQEDALIAIVTLLRPIILATHVFESDSPMLSAVFQL